MDVFLRKYFWIVSLGVAALCGLLIGRAGLRYFESTVLSSKDLRSMPHRATAPTTQAKVYAKDADEIIKRNLFCSTCAPKPEEKTGDASATGPQSNEPQKSALQLELVSTMVVPNDPDWSMAVIRDTSTKEKDPVMYNKGKSIAQTGALITMVVNRKVYFQHNNRLEYIDMDDKTPPAAVPEKKPDAPAAPPAEGGEFDKSINCQGTNCTIERALVDKLLSNTNSLASAARFVPSVKEGKPNGFKVYAIRPNSLFAKIGLQNGDTIKGINGFEMTSPDKALEVYTKLRSASHLGVQLDRRGETVTLDYTIK